MELASHLKLMQVSRVRLLFARDFTPKQVLQLWDVFIEQGSHNGEDSLPRPSKSTAGRKYAFPFLEFFIVAFVCYDREALLEKKGPHLLDRLTSATLND